MQKYSILDLWLGSKNTSNIQTFERKSQQRFVSCQNKLLTKSFFQRNLLALWYLYAFVKGYFFRLFLFHWISELTLQYHLYCNIKLFLCSCISYAHSKQSKMKVQILLTVCSVIFQRFLLHIKCVWYAAILTKTKHFENAFICSSIYSITCFDGKFMWLFLMKSILPEIWTVSNNRAINQISRAQN